jgi:hypothetical protein
MRRHILTARAAHAAPTRTFADYLAAASRSAGSGPRRLSASSQQLNHAVSLLARVARTPTRYGQGIAVRRLGR